MENKKIPELLAPAGSFDAFTAAISRGADAVYLGTPQHNARVNAKNFDREELKKAFDIAGVLERKIYITLNTLVSDRELEEVLSYVDELRCIGANTFIVQDLGLIYALKKVFPDIVLHASTQCVTHSLEQIKALHEMGVSRAVVARELDRDNLYQICRESPVEIEAFVHGALCVSHSGACLFSSLVGGRSGNRGECAQPCRLPFSGAGLDYPLSLSDLSLSDYVTELSEMGIASLKIEGRMKSPEYVGGVVSVFRALLDEGRNITEDEKKHLARLFSRNGFTDGYYAKKLGKAMYGVRRAEDKKETRLVEPTEYILPKKKIDARLEVKSEGGLLEFKTGEKAVEVNLPKPDIAEKRPIDFGFAYSQLSKLGDTPFELDKLDFSADGNYIYPRSILNFARREASEKLIFSLTKGETLCERKDLDTLIPGKAVSLSHYVVFAPHRKPEKEEVQELLKKTDRVYLPLFSFPTLDSYERVGVVMPLVIKDSERGEVEKELSRLHSLGVRRVYAENLGAVKLARGLHFEVLGGVRLNVYNSYTAKVYADLGVEGVMLSPELTPPQKRDIVKTLPSGETLFGRLPLMIMENCIMNLRDGCRECSDFKSCSKRVVLQDRQGVKFPVFPEYFHRCQIFNSVPAYSGDKKPTEGVSFRVIFITDEKDSVETVKDVIQGKSPTLEFTRKG